MRNISIVIYFIFIVTDTVAQTIIYDGLGRATGYIYPNDTTIVIRHDAGGNRLSYKVQRTAPDLAIQNASLNGITSANLGEVIPLSMVVANIGARAATVTSGLRVLLSTDCTPSPNDSVLYQATIPALAAVATHPLSNVSLTLPSRIATGNYKILIVADTSNLIAELDETNNIACLPLQINRFYVSCRGTIPRNGLIAYYPFNGNANDESGNGNHGTVNGATLTQNRFGEANKAYSFNGINNKIVIADANSLDLSTTATLSVWIKQYGANLDVTNNAYAGRIIDKGTPGVDNGYMIDEIHSASQQSTSYCGANTGRIRFIGGGGFNADECFIDKRI